MAKEIETIDVRNVNDELEATFRLEPSEGEAVDSKTKDLQTELERLTCHADKTDYVLSLASGCLAGALTFFLSKNESLLDAKEQGEKAVESFVLKMAKWKGYKGDDTLANAVRHLEGIAPFFGDKLTNEYGGGLQHHLRDFSHHFSFVGLFFSLFAQFTGVSCGCDTKGDFVTFQIDPELRGKSFAEKVALGALQWLFHMASDLAGSSSSIDDGRRGTGLPGPILSFLKLLASTPFFKKLDEKGYKTFSVMVSKLFNGTLIKEDGTIIQFDFRTELGAFLQQFKKGLPVLLNELSVRAFYFASRLIEELKQKKDLRSIEWEKTLPFKNATITRMLTVSSGTMFFIDVIKTIPKAAKTSGGNPYAFVVSFLLNINWIGTIRFAASLGSELSNLHDSAIVEGEIVSANESRNNAIGSKTYIKEKGVYKLVEDSKEFNRSFTRYLRNPAVIALVSALGMWDLTAVGVYSRIREAQKQSEGGTSEEEEKKHTAAAMAASAAIALTNPVSTAIATIHYVRYRKKKSEK